MRKPPEWFIKQFFNRKKNMSYLMVELSLVSAFNPVLGAFIYDLKSLLDELWING